MCVSVFRVRVPASGRSSGDSQPASAQAAASAFIHCSVAMSTTRPQPTKAANEKTAWHFLISSSMLFKEPMDNYTEREKKTDRDKERGIPSSYTEFSLQYTTTTTEILFAHFAQWENMSSPIWALKVHIYCYI